MREVINKYPRLLHGGDYNPEQWLDSPQVLEEDIRLMKEARVNCVSLGIFSWARLEPEEGEFHFGWIRRIIDKLYENGIYTILATPTGAMPNWMTAKYEEVRQMSPEGVRNLPGRRHNFCYTSPIMRKKMKRLTMSCPGIWEIIRALSCGISPMNTAETDPMHPVIVLNASRPSGNG